MVWAVDFIQVSSQQVQGLIEMSIDDAFGLVDLDSNNNGIVVLINGIAFAQTAIFNSGTFNIPALSTAVFVKPQNGAQGYY
jgi:pullulanase